MGFGEIGGNGGMTSYEAVDLKPSRRAWKGGKKASISPEVAKRSRERRAAGGSRAWTIKMRRGFTDPYDFGSTIGYV